MLEVEPRTTPDGFVTNSKLIPKLTNSVNNKLADGFINLLAKNHGALSNFLNCFKAGKDIRSFVVKRVLSHYLRDDFKTVNHISKRVLIEAMYLRNPVNLFKR